MKVDQQVLQSVSDSILPVPGDGWKSQLILVFGPTEKLQNQSLLSAIRSVFPSAYITGCSTSGEITREGALDDAVTITSLRLSTTSIRLERVPVPIMDDSQAAGSKLGKMLRRDKLKYVLLLSDGLNVNGSEVVLGLRTEVGDGVIISGGLAGDGSRFAQTVIIDGEQSFEKYLVGVGFYGDDFAAHSSSASGWEIFGPFRTVTKSQGSIVYEVDGERALDVYSKYLGDEAENLPSSGLYYPLALRIAEQDTGLIRTLLAVDHAQGLLTFAGDVPAGSTVGLMHATYPQLIDGAGRAGQNASLASTETPEFVLLISCVGRKLIMGSQTDLEIEAVADYLPDCPVFSGFHSYGEIGFYEGSGTCELHNQTMTVTTMHEKTPRG